MKGISTAWGRRRQRAAAGAAAVAVIGSCAAVAAMLLIADQPAAARQQQQPTRRGTRPAASAAEVPVFKGRGTPQPGGVTTRGYEVASGAKPRPMSAADRAAIVSEMERAGLGKVDLDPANLYVRVTPSKPSVANKGALIFAGGVVNTREDYAWWGLSPDPTYVTVQLYAPAGGKYLLDFSVWTAEENATSSTRNNAFVIEAVGGNEPARVKGGGQHLTCTLDAAS